MVMMVAPLVMMVAPLVMMVMATVSMHGRLLRRVRDGLHGGLGEGRPAHETGDGERRYGKAWKLHVFSFVRQNPSPDS
jgi:hypothetical protein